MKNSLWHEDKDNQVPPSHAKIFANLIPQAELHLLQNEGHYSLIRNHADDILKSLL